MKRILAALAVMVLSHTQAALTEQQANRIADAIYRIEGGANTRYPYGIKSIKTNNPRQACLNTIYYKRSDWERLGAKGRFTDYLADKYCPPKADPIGNKNWKRNIVKMI